MVAEKTTRKSNNSVIPTDNVNYDKRECYKNEIEELVENLYNLCYLYNIPFVFDAAVYDSDMETKYTGHIIAPVVKFESASKRMCLADDKIDEYCKHVIDYDPYEYFDIDTSNL